MQLRLAGERLVFAPVLQSTVVSRDDRQRWLRMMIAAAMPRADTAQALVDMVTPHSFRAGLAGDLYREGADHQTIVAICRWSSTRLVLIYAQRPPLTLQRSTTTIRLFAWVMYPY